MKYITVKLTEDQHRALTSIFNTSIENYEYDLEHTLWFAPGATDGERKKRFVESELAFYKRLQTILAKAKS